MQINANILMIVFEKKKTVHWLATTTYLQVAGSSWNGSKSLDERGDVVCVYADPGLCISYILTN